MLRKSKFIFVTLSFAFSLSASTQTTALERTTNVDVLLVLATDVSSSVDEENFRLQRNGYSAAITNPLVIEAIRSGPFRRIAICYIEWAGIGEQKVLIDWTLIDSAESASRFSQELANKPRAYVGLTSVGGAIEFATKKIERAPYTAMRRVIDLAGDGDAANSGSEPILFRDETIGKGITINALVILTHNMLLTRDPSPFNPGSAVFHTGHLEHYYRYNVIGGPAAFVMAVTESAAFGETITKKLVSEIAGVPVKYATAKPNQQVRIADR